MKADAKVKRFFLTAKFFRKFFCFLFQPKPEEVKKIYEARRSRSLIRNKIRYLTGSFTRFTICSIISFVMSFPLESGCKSRGFECNSQIYWKFFFIILKQFYRMHWLSAMLDNIFFTCTRKTEGVWHLYYIYNALWSAANHLKKSEKKRKQHGKKGKVTGENSGNSTGKREKLLGKTAETAREKGKTSGQKRERWLKIQGTEPGNSGQTPEKQRPRHCKFPEEISKQKKNHPENEKTAEGRKSKDAPGWRRKTGKRQNGRRFSSKATE